MTDERVAAIANNVANRADEVADIAAAIRLALAERDREVAEWVKANEQQHDWIEGLEYVLVSDLAAFLEAGT